MRKIHAAILGVLIGSASYAQIGLTVVPYFWSTSFRSDMYSRTNGFGNIPVGIDVLFNYNNKLFAEFSTFKMMGEKDITLNDNYGYGVPGGFTHRKFRWTEFHVDYTLIGKRWEDMDKWAPALALRAGVLYNSRMTMIAPQVGHDTVYTNTAPFIADSIVSLNRFDLTGVRQTMLTCGLSLKIMRNKQLNFSGSGSWWKDLTTGEIFYVPEGSGNSYSRVRQWDFYADFIYAPVSHYDGYLGWDDHQLATRAISGDEIVGVEQFGWRWGIKHMAYNILGLQWVIEYMQLPGQKRFPDTEDLDEPIRKNRYFLIGLNVSLGFSAGN